ncbi:class 1 isoprenoid biosynthesis enzyme [Bacillus luti]|uniref:class 1 isoprenoid biosynthesis enzyme n=1 Tax=Bacillus luti TaxID=2026191 RepID=UPI003776A4C8
MKKVKRFLFRNVYIKWLERDFNKKLELLEEFRLRKHVQAVIEENSEVDESLPEIIDYVAAFVISMYRDHEQVPETKYTLEDEVEYVIQQFIESYQEGIKTKKTSLYDYFAIPPLNPYLKQRTIEEIPFQSRKGEFNLNNLEILFDKFNHYLGNNHKRFVPGIKHYAVALWYIVHECIQDVKAFSKLYNIHYVEDGEQRCLFNYFNLYIHGVLFTEKMLLDDSMKEVMFAASAIHPAQDDFIDKNDMTEQDIQNMLDKIEGKDVKPLNQNVANVFQLIDILYKHFPIDQHATLVKILTELHKWQIHSLKQRGNELDEEQLLEVSLNKGGYAFAFYGYIALGKMDIMEFRHFFGMGAIFQLMDDLHDIEIDLEECIQTIWTMRIMKQEDAAEALYGIIAIQQKFEEITTLIESLNKPVFIRRMELFAIRLDLLKFYMLNKQYINDGFIESLESHFNIDVSSIAENYKIQLDGLKTFDDFLDMLYQVKHTYTQKILKR